MVEIELKARVTEPELLKERINSRLGRQPISCHKEDFYFSHLQSAQGENKELLFRLRIERNQVSITRKWKERLSDSSEENMELEFVSPEEDFPTIRRFFESLGFVETANKCKQGYLWPAQGASGLSVELVEVGPLGWFVELEILVDDTSSDTKRAEVRNELFTLYKELGLSISALEGAYYLDLLAAEQE